jgi:hypothetical protein
MHKYRISFISGLATGFVLGTRAGRERYEQIKKIARSVADNPSVQQAAGAAQAQATGLVSSAGAKVSDRVPQLAKTALNKVEDRVPGRRHKNGDGDDTANGSRTMGETASAAASGHRDRKPKH